MTFVADRYGIVHIKGDKKFYFACHAGSGGKAPSSLGHDVETVTCLWCLQGKHVDEGMGRPRGRHRRRR